MNERKNRFIVVYLNGAKAARIAKKSQITLYNILHEQLHKYI